jgi:hypothetical protein
MALYEITIKGSKTFYVEAETEDKALEHPIVNDEMYSGITGIEWEAMEAEADKQPDFIADNIRANEPKLIFD